MNKKDCNPKTNLKQAGKEIFLSGFSCGEAVIKTAKNCNILNIPEELINVASAFKAGIGCKGDTCGCLLGIISLVGLNYYEAADLSFVFLSTIILVGPLSFFVGFLFVKRGFCIFRTLLF